MVVTKRGHIGLLAVQMRRNGEDVTDRLSGFSELPLLERLVIAAESIDRKLNELLAAPMSAAFQKPTKSSSILNDSFSINQCVELSGISESTIRRSIRDGSLVAHTIGSGKKRPTYRIWRADLEAYLEAGRSVVLGPLRVATTTVRKKSRHFD
jgi:excisionase family DNA binding protein